MIPMWNFQGKIVPFLDKDEPVLIDDEIAKHYYESMCNFTCKKKKFQICHCCNSLGYGEYIADTHAAAESQTLFMKKNHAQTSNLAFEEWKQKILKMQKRWHGNDSNQILSYTWNKLECQFFAVHQRNLLNQKNQKSNDIFEKKEETEFVLVGIKEILKECKKESFTTNKRQKAIEAEIQNLKNVNECMTRILVRRGIFQSKPTKEFPIGKERIKSLRLIN